jgi:ubiquinone biosynthesis protein UbiJ
MLPASLILSLNAVLDTQPQLQSRLATHNGKFIRLTLAGLDATLEIDDLGHLLPAPEGADPALTLTPDLTAFPRLLTGGQMADLFRIQGDGLLAADLAAALRDFDWVLALRPWLGDLAAARAEQFFKEFTAWQPKAVESVGRNLAEYAVYEAKLLAEPEAVREFIAEVDRLREDMDRFEARMALLEGRR